jgi:hypothetical protein
MPTVRRVIHAVLFAAAITTGSSPAVVLGCSCSEYPTFEQAFLQSAAVFRGTVTSIVPADPSYFMQVWVTLQTTAWWKGAASETATVMTGANEAICGYPFVIGSEYLVFAPVYNVGGPLQTHLCWRTHAPWAGDPDLVSLGPPYTIAIASKSWGGIKALYRR